MTSTKTYVQLQEKYDRVVVLIDMDCFYCQVEEYLDPERLTGKPIGLKTSHTFETCNFRYV
jgi:DNA polymerase eta